MQIRKFWLLILSASTAAFLPVSAFSEEKKVFETQLGAVELEKVASGIDTPWAMGMLPNGKLVVTERDGRMLLVEPNGKNAHKEISGVPDVWARGQGGLLDVVIDPNFDLTNHIYFTFSDQKFLGGAGTAIARATLNQGDKPSLSDVKILYSMPKKTSAGQHFGSRIAIERTGNLYFTIGDRGQPQRAQDPKDPAGSVIRIGPNGEIPSDNPFADGKKGLPEIWSIGHRNPQGATINPATDELWTLAHGAKGGDEINIPEAGKNYGWPRISYGVNYSGTKIGIGTEAEGYEQPIYYWDPSIAPSGMDFYDGDLVPQWKGNLFIGALKYQQVSRLVVDGDKIVSEEALFQGELGRIRDVRSFPDGALWILTNDGEGSIYRITGK